MSYAELDEFGKLRQVNRMGPLAMFEHLQISWARERGLNSKIVADKVKKFFRYYSINRHKSTVLTPAYHCQDYGTDDNRFDMRQFLYDTNWEV